MSELAKEKRDIEQELETKMKEYKGLKNQIEMKKVLKGKVEVAKNHIVEFKKDNKPLDLAKERETLDKKKTKFIAEGRDSYFPK